MSELPLYLDYAATTPIAPEVLESMLPFMQSAHLFGNPSSKTHVYGKEAKQAVELARAQAAALLQADPAEIVFTACATESINMALKGIMDFHHRRGKHLITVKTEHKAVLATCAYLERQGCEVTYLTPQPNGLIDLNELKQTLRVDTVLVSIMHINNEMGVVQDIAAIAEVVKARGAFFHVDAVQSAGKLDINTQKIAVDLLSFSGHKLYAPKGIGALYVRKQPKVRLTPLLHGAMQENGMRAGTLAVHQIVGLGKAFQLAKDFLPQAHNHYMALRDAFLQAMQALKGWQLNGSLETCHPSIVNLSFSHVQTQDLLTKIDTQLAVSTGAACTTASLEPSYVLTALGLPADLATNALRLSFGRDSSIHDAQKAAKILSDNC